MMDIIRAPLIFACLCSAVATLTTTASASANPNGGLGDAWAVIVSTSRYYHNYRHTNNALAVYSAAKQSGIPDSRIILMIADDHVCEARNPFKGQMFSEENHQGQLFCPSIEIDYKGDAVSAATFLSVLRGSMPRSPHLAKTATLSKELLRTKNTQSTASPYTGVSTGIHATAPIRQTFDASVNFIRDRVAESPTPSSSFSGAASASAADHQEPVRVPVTSFARSAPLSGPVLETSNTSNVFVYITGHSGENFMKFHDYEFMFSTDVADAFQSMWDQQKYARMFYIADTCQAETLFEAIEDRKVPNVYSVGSSIIEQDSLSAAVWILEIGSALIDGFAREFYHLFRTYYKNAEFVDPAKKIKENARQKASMSKPVEISSHDDNKTATVDPQSTQGDVSSDKSANSEKADVMGGSFAENSVPDYAVEDHDVDAPELADTRTFAESIEHVSTSGGFDAHDPFGSAAVTTEDVRRRATVQRLFRGGLSDAGKLNRFAVPKKETLSNFIDKFTFERIRSNAKAAKGRRREGRWSLRRFFHHPDED